MNQRILLREKNYGLEYVLVKTEEISNNEEIHSPQDMKRKILSKRQTNHFSHQDYIGFRVEIQIKQEVSVNLPYSDIVQQFIEFMLVFCMIERWCSIW